MPVSRELLGRLVENAASDQERFIVLLVSDLDGHRVELSDLNISDIDRSSNVLSPKRGGHSVERVRLGAATLMAFHEYISRRRGQEPALFVEDQGKRQTTDEIMRVLDQIAERAGLLFDHKSFRFGSPPKERTPRIATKAASKDLFYLYGIVSHPLRRKIVEVLGGEGPTSFTTLKRRVEAKVGTLYYHLDMLKGLVAQDSQKRYQLTSVGVDAYTRLQSSEYVESSSLLVQNLPENRGLVERVASVLALGPLWPRVVAGSILPKIGAVGLVGLGAYLVYLARLETVLLFLNPVLTGSTLLSLEFISAWIIVYGIADIVGTFLFHRKGEHIALLLATGYALTPLLGFALWWNLVVYYSFRTPLVSTFVFSRVLLIVLQAWSLGILAQAVSSVKGLRLERAAVVSLSVAYMNILIAYLRGI
jgi:hypothetical protein